MKKPIKLPYSSFINGINIDKSFCDTVINHFKSNIHKANQGSITYDKDNVINKIRLSYIDAPEIRQSYGEKSKAYLKKILLNKKVIVSPKKYKDRYGRFLAEIYIHNDNEAIYINAKMIKSGNAWVYKSYRSNSYLINLENHAKINNKDRAKAFSDRHNCPAKKDKLSPGYWSCNLPRYAKELGLKGGGNYFW